MAASSAARAAARKSASDGSGKSMSESDESPLAVFARLQGVRAPTGAVAHGLHRSTLLLYVQLDTEYSPSAFASSTNAFCPQNSSSASASSPTSCLIRFPRVVRTGRCGGVMGRSLSSSESSSLPLPLPLPLSLPLPLPLPLPAASSLPGSSPLPLLSISATSTSSASSAMLPELRRVRLATAARIRAPRDDYMVEK